MKIYKYEKTWSLIIILIVTSLAKDALYLPPCGYVASVFQLDQPYHSYQSYQSIVQPVQPTVQIAKNQNQNFIFK